MVLRAFHTNALSELCSQDQLELLDSIDCLRSQGISHYVSLPQIIVCGDQSSGKSSVLEAISGVSFPIKSNLCTRFPTELVLRKTSSVGVSVSIVPDQSRSEAEQLSLGSFHESLEGFDGFTDLIEHAKVAMGISTHGRAFSKDILRVEVSGPDRPHLTIVDLPGLVHSETKQQTASDVELVQDVVQQYMKEPRSIILAVVSAKNDYANQIVLKLARAADKKLDRTLGVITKPDTLIAGSESEAMYVSLARNDDVKFRLGWHVLKNMDTEKGHWSLAERDAEEEEFFAQRIWKELSPSLLGIDKLRKRLSKVLVGQIAAELPSLVNEIESKSETCQQKLEKLGEPRASLAEQRLYLIHISQLFQSLVKASVDGTYNDPFFGDAKSKSGYQKRFRAVVQNQNLDFAELISRRGHLREIIENENEGETSRGATTILRDEYIDHIEDLMKRTRGRELPGTFNPMIVADLFLEQSTPWEAITKSHIENVWKAAKDFIILTTSYIADTATSKALFQNIFEPTMNQLLKDLKTKMGELLTPHRRSHPITYNHYFTETLQKVRNKRSEDDFAVIIRDFFGASDLRSVETNYSRDLRPLVQALVRRTVPDMNRYASSEALGCMEAYYKVALKRFVDDIAVEVVEAKLVSQIDHIFSPTTVTSMHPDLVDSIAGESEENRAEREQLRKQLDVLRKGSETCKRFISIKFPNAGVEMVQLSHPSEDMPYEIIEPEEHDLSAPEDDRSLSDGSSNQSLVEEPEVLIEQTEQEPRIPDEPIDEYSTCEPEYIPDPSSFDISGLKKKDKKKMGKKKTKGASVSVWD